MFVRLNGHHVPLIWSPWGPDKNPTLASLSQARESAERGGLPYDHNGRKHYVYIYIFTYVYIYIYICMSILYIYIYTYTCTYTYT